ncbi:MAG: hypothetical protein KDC32_20265 [Saprospiraceae bacterium]|nr:hypothetical protein [Saprospiraceae bacterium]
MKFIDVNIVRLEKNGFGRLQPVWSRGLVNTGEIKSLREGYPPEGMEGRVCILQMTDGSEITVKASMEYVKHELAAASVHTHTNFDEMDEETKVAFSRMVVAAIEYLKKGIAP